MGKIEVKKVTASVKGQETIRFSCPFCGAGYRGRWLIVGCDWGVKIERDDGKHRYCPHYTGDTERMGNDIVAFIFLKKSKGGEVKDGAPPTLD